MNTSQVNAEQAKTKLAQQNELEQNIADSYSKFNAQESTKNLSSQDRLQAFTTAMMNPQETDDTDDIEPEPESPKENQYSNEPFTFDYIKAKAGRGEALTVEEADLLEEGYRQIESAWQNESWYAQSLEENQTKQQKQQAEFARKQWYADKTAAYKEAVENFNENEAARLQTEIADGPPAQEAAKYSPREMAYFNAWVKSRPYLQEGSPYEQYVVDQAVALQRHPGMQGADLKTLLDTLDQVMVAQLSPEQQPSSQEAVRRSPPKKQTKTAKQAPKDSGLTGPEQSVAHNLFRHLSPAEAEKRYQASREHLKKMGKL